MLLLVFVIYKVVVVRETSSFSYSVESKLVNELLNAYGSLITSKNKSHFRFFLDYQLVGVAGGHNLGLVANSDLVAEVGLGTSLFKDLDTGEEILLYL